MFCHDRNTILIFNHIYFQVPVASKLCTSCSHQFFEERRRSTASNPSETEDVEDLSLRDMKASRGIGAIGDASGIMAMASGKDLASAAPEGKRRSERVKREKPNFYDALEYENQMRKVSCLWNYIYIFILDSVKHSNAHFLWYVLYKIWQERVTQAVSICCVT